MNKNALFFTGLCSLFMAGMPTVSATAESHTPGDDKATATQEKIEYISFGNFDNWLCLLYTSPSPRDLSTSRMPSSA